MNDNKQSRFRIGKLAWIAFASIFVVSSISFAISRYVIEQQKPGREETLRLANEAYDRGDFQQSSFLYGRYIKEFDPSNISVMIDYGYSLHNIGKSDEGISILEHVLTMQPNNAFALFNIAVIHYREGNKSKAKESMKVCIDKGDNPEIVEKAKLLFEQM